MHTRLLFSLVFISLSGFIPSVAKAQSVIDISIPAGTCINCHTPDSSSTRLLPSIAGQPEAVLQAQLMAFKSEKPPANTTIMDRLVNGFNDDEIAALAQYFSQLPAASSSQKGTLVK